MPHPTDPSGPTSKSDTRDPAGADRPDEPDTTTWPPFLPHREIDALIDRLDQARSLDPAEAYRLLGLIAKEAQRLRSLVLRLSSAKLSEADREAREIVAAALGQADALRSTGLSVLDARLDEADEVLSTMRQAFRIELRAAEAAQTVTPFPHPFPRSANQPSDPDLGEPS